MGNVVPEGNMKKSWYHSIDVGSLELINNIHILGRECDTSMSGSSPAINLAAEPGLLHFLYKQMVLYLRHLCHWIVVENVHSRAIFVILFLREVVAVFCSVVESTSQAMPSVGILSSETSLLMRKNQSREKISDVSDESILALPGNYTHASSSKRIVLVADGWCPDITALWLWKNSYRACFYHIASLKSRWLKRKMILEWTEFKTICL